MMGKEFHIKSLLTATLIGITVLAVAACGGGQTPIPTPTRTDTPPPTVTPPLPPEQPPTPTPSPDVTLKDPGGPGSKYVFDPTDLTFSVGETVALVLKSETQFHTFTVEALGIDVGVDGGKTETLEHTFDKAGTYDLICIPHEALGMTGSITVR